MVRTHDINGNLLKKIEDCDLNSTSLILQTKEEDYILWTVLDERMAVKTHYTCEGYEDESMNRILGFHNINLFK